MTKTCQKLITTKEDKKTILLIIEGKKKTAAFCNRKSIPQEDKNLAIATSTYAKN